MATLLEKAIARKFVRKLFYRCWKCGVCGMEGTTSYTISHASECPLCGE